MSLETDVFSVASGMLTATLQMSHRMTGHTMSVRWQNWRHIVAHGWVKSSSKVVCFWITSQTHLQTDAVW